MNFATPMNAGSDILFQANPFENIATVTAAPAPTSAPVESPDDDPIKDQAGLGAKFNTFADALRCELPARSELEKVLIERVILASWRLRVASEQDIDRIVTKDKVTPVTPEILRAECSLETAFSLLETARRVSRPEWGRSSEIDLGTRPAVDDESDIDDRYLIGDSGELDDLSNEWPILNADSNPRDAFREFTRENHEDEVDAEDEVADEADPTRWQDRLVFDFNVSEISPVVKGTWITVNQVVSMIVDGCRWSDILRDHPELTEEDIRTCLAYTIEQDDFGTV